jgi:hypothetical protein
VFSLVLFSSEGISALAERERETGKWTQFDWMLDRSNFKVQPIEFWLFCFKRKPIDVSQKYISLPCFYILYQEKHIFKKNNMTQKL